MDLNLLTTYAMAMVTVTINGLYFFKGEVGAMIWIDASPGPERRMGVPFNTNKSMPWTSFMKVI